MDYGRLLLRYGSKENPSRCSGFVHAVASESCRNVSKIAYTKCFEEITDVIIFILQWEKKEFEGGALCVIVIGVAMCMECFLHHHKALPSQLAI